MGRLVQVVYKPGAVELAACLLDLRSFDYSRQNVEIAPPGSVGLGSFPAGTAWGDLRAGYFAYNFDLAHGKSEIWFGATRATSPGANAGAENAFLDAAYAIQRYYAGLGASPVTGDPGNPSSYSIRMNGGTPGRYAGYNGDPASGEAGLAGLASSGYADIYLYHFNLNTLQKGPSGQDFAAILRLSATGSTVLNPSELPVPASILLLGSGLLGLASISRRGAGERSPGRSGAPSRGRGLSKSNDRNRVSTESP